MVNGDDNENGFKTNTSNQQKNKMHVQHTFSSNQQKTNLHVQHAFLSFPCCCFTRLQRCFVRLKRHTSYSSYTLVFMEELSYVLTQYHDFVSCVHVRFYFSLPLIFTLLVASISHFLTAALNFHVFLPKKFVSWSSSFSVVHVNVNIKNNAEKDTTLLLFFLLNKTLSRIGVAIPVD